MGVWGTGLYSNDTACDIRDEYKDLLRRGKNSKEATETVIKLNEDCFGDVEEEPLFWFALADTQWNYGRLDEQVKRKALEWLNREEELQRWDESENGAALWRKTRDKLREKLVSDQPPEKKVPRYRVYHCDWELGGVYAYRLHEEDSKEQNMYGKYMVFRKISERKGWPEDYLPEVEFYRWVGTDIPSLEQVRQMQVLPIVSRRKAGEMAQMCEQGVVDWNLENTRYITCVLCRTAFRDKLREHVTYLGTMDKGDLQPFPEENLQGIACFTPYSMEEQLIHYYREWQ